MKEDVIRDKSYKFALRMVKLSRYLVEEKKESLLKDCEELQKILVASIKTAKS